VSASGATFVEAIDPSAIVTTNKPLHPSSAGALPSGYLVVDDLAFEISTTATVTGPMTICFDVSSVTDQAVFAGLRVFHNEDGVLVDRTILSPDAPAPDFAAKMICARVNSLGTFVLASNVAPCSFTLSAASASWPANGGADQLMVQSLSR